MEVRLKDVLDQLSEDKINLIVNDSSFRAGWDSPPKECGSQSGSGSSSSGGGWCHESDSSGGCWCPKF